MRKGGVASIGECMLELSGGKNSNWRLGYAGDTFNTLWAIRALTPESMPADYVSAFGDDPFSVQQKAFFAENGIGTAASPVIPGRRPGLYAITLTGAERSFTYWRADSAARLLADDKAALEKSLENRQLIYFSGITLAILEEDARKTAEGEPNYERRWSDALDPSVRTKGPGAGFKDRLLFGRDPFPGLSGKERLQRMRERDRRDTKLDIDLAAVGSGAGKDAW